MRSLVLESRLEHAIEVDSAGTGGYHVGELPDARARAAGKRHGIELRGRARRVEPHDFTQFDYLVAMDGSNLEDLSELALPEFRQKITLLRAYDPTAPAGAGVPDPYYGALDGFDEVIEICQRGCRGLLDHIRREHSL